MSMHMSMHRLRCMARRSASSWPVIAARRHFAS
jgi:hypothetical protein